MFKKACLLALIGVAAGTLVAPISTASAATPPALSYQPVSTWWGTNDRVSDIATVGNRVYLSGGFDYIGPQTGHGTAVDGTTGLTAAVAPIVSGTVNASVSDGAGGWYIGGKFNRVGGLPRQNAAQIDAAGRVTSWNPNPDDSVQALAVAGDEVVLGGSFAHVGKGPVAAAGLAAVDRIVGAPMASFHGAADSTVYSLLAAGPSIYVGGQFTKLNGSQWYGVARLDATTGAVDYTFAASASARVLALALSPDGSTLYGGGDFAWVWGPTWTSTPDLAAWSTATGAQRPWTPKVDGPVEALATDPTTGTVYVGGQFSTVNGVPRARLAAVDPNGSTTAWDPALSGCLARHTIKYSHTNPPCTPEVSALTAANGNLYVGGLFGQSGGVSRHDVAAFSLSNGALTAWDPRASDRVLTLGPSGGSVFVGGDLTSVNGLVRKGVAALDAGTGVGDPTFRADTDDEVLDLQPSPDGSTLYLAGHFVTVNGTTRKKVAAVSTTDGHVLAFRPDANNDVLSLAYAGGSLYAAGQFVKIGGLAKSHAAKLDPLTGKADPRFASDTVGPAGPLLGNGMVQSMAAAPDGSRVYLSGPFDTVNGQSVAFGIVAVRGDTGTVTNQFTGVDGCSGQRAFINHLYLSDDGKRLYAGDICPDKIYQWDTTKLTAPGPAAPTWKTYCNGGMQGVIEIDGNLYYGTHGTTGQGTLCWAAPWNGTYVPRSRYAVFDGTTGATLPDAPQFGSAMGVWSFGRVSQGLLVGGDFDWVGSGDTVRQGLAPFPGTP